MNEPKSYYEDATQGEDIIRYELSAFVVWGLMRDRTKAVLTFHGLIWWMGPDIVPGLTDRGFGMAYRLGLFQQIVDPDNEYYKIMNPPEEPEELVAAARDVDKKRSEWVKLEKISDEIDLFKDAGGYSMAAGKSVDAANKFWEALNALAALVEGVGK